MSTVSKYFPTMPDQYRPIIVNPEEDDYIVDEILAGLNDNFGSSWGGFERKYVEDTICDRLISYISAGWNLAFHMRIFDKDFNGRKCFGVGGVFKTFQGGPEDVNRVFRALRRYAAEDVCIGFGMAPEDLCKYYVRHVLGGHYVDYNDTHKIYYVEFNNYKVTDEDIKVMQSFEMF